MTHDHPRRIYFLLQHLRQRLSCSPSHKMFNIFVERKIFGVGLAAPIELCNTFKPCTSGVWWFGSQGLLQSIPLCSIYGLNNPNMSMLLVYEDGRHFMSTLFVCCETASLSDKGYKGRMASKLPSIPETTSAATVFPGSGSAETSSAYFVSARKHLHWPTQWLRGVARDRLVK